MTVAELVEVLIALPPHLPVVAALDSDFHSNVRRPRVIRLTPNGKESHDGTGEEVVAV